MLQDVTPEQLQERVDCDGGTTIPGLAEKEEQFGGATKNTVEVPDLEGSAWAMALTNTEGNAGKVLGAR